VARRLPPLVASLGLLAVLAALLDRYRDLDAAAPAIRVTFTVPEALVAATTIVIAATAIVMLVAARSRRASEDAEAEPQREPFRRTWWGQVLGPVIAMIPLLAIVAIMWMDGGRLANELLAFGRWLNGGAGVVDPANAPVVVPLPWLGFTVGLVALVVALLMLACALVVLFAERVAAWLSGTEEAGEAEALLEVVDEGLDDLADEPEPRAAIIAAYRRFERAAARARVRRAPWQTAGEFMRDAQRHLPIPGLAVERLTRLFELARFSDHPVRASDRDLARACLEEIRAALVREETPVAVA
jgi:hypothetical protein